MQEQEIKSSSKSLIIRIIKIVVFALLLCGVMCLSLKWYLESVPATLEYLEEEERPNTLWLVQYGSVLLPVVSVAVLLTAAYRIGNGYIPVKTQRDKAIISALVCVFTYAYLFVKVCELSQGWNLPPSEGTEDVKSVLERSIIWFCVQAVSFLIMISYHVIRASSEKKALSEQMSDGSEDEQNE